MNLQPFRILREAVRAVPAVKYALGVAGIVAVVAIAKTFSLSPAIAAFGTIVTLVLMVALVVFAKLTTTAPRHFLMPVLVLMWSFLGLTIAAACLLFSSVFFKWPTDLPHLLETKPASKETGQRPAGSISNLLQAVGQQVKAGEIEGAWKLVSQAVALQPDSSEAQQAQVQVAMAWLRNIQVREPHTFTEVVDQVAPCLYQAAATAKGALAGDVLAHIGWANFLKFREQARQLEIEGQYAKALQQDKSNPYAHAMWGHWILWQHGKVADAQAHFVAALKTGREKNYVRELQVSAIRSASSSESRSELIRIANEMRKERESLPKGDRSRVLSEVYWSNSKEILEQLPTILPPDDHLATFLWLTEGIEASAYQTFFLARLTEGVGSYSNALTLYLSLLPHSFVLEKEVKQGISRCKKQLGQARADLETLLLSARDPDAKARQHAVRGLPKVDAEPIEILPTLLGACQDQSRDVRAAACEALVELGLPAVPGLIEMLDTGKPRELANAAAVLGRIGPSAKEAVTALIKALGNQDEEARSAVVSALAEMGPDAAAAVPALVALCQSDEGVQIPLLTAYALGEIGPAAKPAVPLLITLLKDTRDRKGFLNDNAADALGKIGPAAAPAVPALIEALSSDDVRLPTRATVALGEIGAGAKAAIPALLEAMKAQDKEHRINQADSLVKIAQSLMEHGDTDSIADVQSILKALQKENFQPEITGPVQEALQSLKEKRAVRTAC